MPTAALPSPQLARIAAARLRQVPLWLTWLFVIAWVLLPARLHGGQWGDHFEAFSWAHSLEWGYAKHPPLPTWLLGACQRLVGPWPYWPYLLAGTCVAATAYCTHRIALTLLPARAAALAILLWGGQQAFSARAQLFNHNTVLMACVAVAALCALRAATHTRRHWWVGAGLAAGAAMLSKYQAVVPLAGIGVALWLNGDLRRPEVRRGAALASAIAGTILVPHLAWMVLHDFTTLRYAAQEGQTLGWGDRGLSIVSFLAQQVRLLFPSLLMAALLWWWPGLRQSAVAASEDDRVRRWRRAWFAGLVLFPLVVTLATCPAFGLKLQNHWGYQCLQFVSLWFAWRLRGVTRRGIGRIATAAVAVQVTHLALAHTPWLQPAHGGRDDRSFPAETLAQAIDAQWRLETTCPLRVVIGPTFEAGMVSAYSRTNPRVLEDGDFRRSPWMTPQELLEAGAVFVSMDRSALPDGPQEQLRSLQLIGDGARPLPPVYWRLVPPRRCAAPPLAGRGAPPAEGVRADASAAALAPVTVR